MKNLRLLSNDELISTNGGYSEFAHDAGELLGDLVQILTDWEGWGDWAIDTF
jgi:hypothetical protein